MPDAPPEPDPPQLELGGFGGAGVLSGGFGGVCDAPCVAGALCGGGGGIAGFGGGAGAAGRGGGGAAGRGAAAAGGATGGRGAGAAVGVVIAFGSAFGFGAAFFFATVLRLAGAARPFAALPLAVRALARAATPRFAFFAGAFAFAFLRPFDFGFALRAIKPPLSRG